MKKQVIARDLVIGLVAVLGLTLCGLLAFGQAEAKHDPRLLSAKRLLDPYGTGGFGEGNGRLKRGHTPVFRNARVQHGGAASFGAATHPGAYKKVRLHDHPGRRGDLHDRRGTGQWHAARRRCGRPARRLDSRRGFAFVKPGMSSMYQPACRMASSRQRIRLLSP